MGYCERCGKEFDSHHECPDCYCNEEYDLFCRLAPKINKNKVICSNCGQEIYEARRHCRYCGALNPFSFKNNGEGYCPDCGISFVDGVCPNCGKKPSNFRYEIHPNDTVAYNCDNCGKTHHTIYHFCIDCGNNNRTNLPKKVILEPKPVVHKIEPGTYCYKCGHELDMDDCCPKCHSDYYELCYKPKINENKIKCQSCGNETYEIRRYCDCCGAKNPFADKHNGEGYCPDCGTSFVNGVCPNCGKKPKDFRYNIPSTATHSYNCSKCGKPHDTIYHFCIDCGNDNRINIPNRVPLERKPESTESSGNRPSSSAEKYKPTTRETVSYYEEPPEIKSTLWLILGIISVVICCMPTGIGTIIYSIQASNCAREGMIKRAKRKLRTAKVWFFAGSGIIALLMIASVIIQVTQ